MKVIYNPYLPFKGFTAMNLFGLILAREECKPLSRVTLCHEAIHTAQMMELLYVFFYLWYIIEWLIRLIQYRNASKAYRNISFEREAYANQNSINYLQGRSIWNWIHYLKSA